MILLKNIKSVFALNMQTAQEMKNRGNIVTMCKKGMFFFRIFQDFVKIFTSRK
jgi:hypothetical protein